MVQLTCTITGYLHTHLHQCGHCQAKGERYLRHCGTAQRSAAHTDEDQEECAQQFAKQHPPDVLVLRDVGDSNEFRHGCKRDKQQQRELVCN